MPSSSTAWSVCSGLPEDASATRKPRSFSSRTSSVAPGSGRTSARSGSYSSLPALAQLVAVAPLDLVAGDARPPACRRPCRWRGAPPTGATSTSRLRKARAHASACVVGGVDQGAVDVEQDGARDVGSCRSAYRTPRPGRTWCRETRRQGVSLGSVRSARSGAGCRRRRRSGRRSPARRGTAAGARRSPRRRCRGRRPCRSARCARRPSAAAPGRAAGPPPGASRTCRTPGSRRSPRAGRSRSSPPCSRRAA